MAVSSWMGGVEATVCMQQMKHLFTGLTALPAQGPACWGVG